MASMREMEYRTTRDYGSLTSINHHPSTGPSKHYRPPSPYDDRSNFKRSRSDAYETLSKRPMMRREQFQH